jgi:hypothetical protein
VEQDDLMFLQRFLASPISPDAFRRAGARVRIRAGADLGVVVPHDNTDDPGHRSEVVMPALAARAHTLPLTLEVIGAALDARSATRGTIVRSVSVDDRFGRTRLELELAPDAVNAASLACAAAEVFRETFSAASGALRVDVYDGGSGSIVAGSLLATHADFLDADTRRAP